MISFDSDKDTIKILFEIMSAFSTCGLSMGVTHSLSLSSQIILLITMFLGRVGPLTIALAFSRERDKGNYRYPKENILIG
jgi:V-type sodium ATP synthase subunit J